MMEDSLSSSYDSARTRAIRKKQHSSTVCDSSRGGPEGNSLGLHTHTGKLSTSTPAAVSVKQKKPAVSRNKLAMSGKANDDQRLDSFTSTNCKKNVKRKVSKNCMGDDGGNSFESVDSKRSRLSSTGSGVIDSNVKKKKTKIAKQPVTDLSWEMAVEKARGMPDGAMTSDQSESMDEDEIDVDASPPQKPACAVIDQAKGKTKSFNVIQNAAKKLKPKKGKDSKENNLPKSSTKRKSEEDLNGVQKKKVKAEEPSKKERKLQRKMLKNNYEIAQKAKDIWEQLRKYDLPHEKRKQLSTELYDLLKGKAKDLIFAHDTSRVIQCMLKYGTQEHKNAIFEELREHIVEMAKSKYAKFFVRKLLKYGTKAQRNYVFRKLYGNVRKLIKHKEAGEIIECAYNDYANAVQRQALVQEFYGPSFALFKTSEQRSLEQIIQSNPEKRDSILSNMKEALIGLADKSILQFSIVHRVFLDFFTYATEKLRTEMIEAVRDGVIHMLHTREGSRVAMLCLWHGTAKDRKVIVKSFKTYVVKICKEEFGYLVMLAIFDVVDDTKLVQKALLDELLKSVHEVALDQYGRKVLLYLLSPRDPVHFHPDIIKILKQGDNNPHSKKEPEVRRRELLEYVSRPLIQYITQHCKELVTNNAALLLILAIITHAKSDPTDAMRAVSELAAEPFVAGSLENCHIVEHTAGHLTLKRLILNDAQRIENGESALFSGILLDILPEGSLKSWAACNRGCFILLCLLEVNHHDIHENVLRQLKGVKSLLRKLDFKGARLLMEKLEG